MKKIEKFVKKPARRPLARPVQVNNGFWDLPAEDRAVRMEAACERGNAGNFYDLSPEERGRAYDGV